MGGKTHRKGSSRRVTRTVLAPILDDPVATSIKSATRSKYTRKQLAAQTARNEERVRELYKGIDADAVALVREQAVKKIGPHIIDQTSDSAPQDQDMDWIDEIPVEDEFVRAMRDVQRLPGKSKTRTSAWQQRKAREVAAWIPLLQDLTSEFMNWRHSKTKSPSQTRPQHSSIISEDSSALNPDDPPALNNTVPEQSYFITVAAFDIFTRVDQVTVTLSPGHASPAIDLMAHGWVSKTPERPSIVVSITTLELFHRLRARKPSFSVEAFAKVVCDYYNIPFRSYLRRVFADTYELYSVLRRREDKQVREALKWDTPDWRPLNACRPCCYVLEDEPALTYSRLVAMDGNNSLKRMALKEDRVAGDTRVLSDSTYFLSHEYVDRFANEVRGRRSKGPAVKGKKVAGDSDSDDDSDDGTGEIVEGDPTDGLYQALETQGTSEVSDTRTGEPAAPASQEARAHAPTASASKDAHTPNVKSLIQCTKNWKAAAAEDKKRMWSIFDEAGVFACACRHGFILWVMDMVKSGELAKYPLAVIAKILETMAAGAMVGYDIGCSFDATILFSSLAQAFKDKDLHLCVNAFHGYSHSHDCQIRYHPNNIIGTGIEDLETLERVFSSSNQLASVIRYASPYRRRLMIEAHYEQWDDDKYHNLGNFILNNYVQALKIIHEEGAALEASKNRLQMTDEQIHQWSDEERSFFATLGEESAYDIHAVAYVELLQQLSELDLKRNHTNTRFLSYAPSTDSAAYERDTAQTRRLESERRHARTEHARVSLEVCELEVKLEIKDRWTPVTPAYIAAATYLRERKYQRALEKLQRLVIQRLFELHKLNVSQTGYKLRMHIAKSLQVRCKTIRKAVISYNSAAAALNPPRPALDWSAVSHYGFLEEFSLLQGTRNDIREKPWAKPEVRATMKLHNRVERAREELVRLNVEVRRLHTAILDEDILFTRTLAGLEPSSSIHGALSKFADRRRNVNDVLLERIADVYSLAGYTGEREPGKAVVSMYAHLPADESPDSLPDIHMRSNRPATIAEEDGASSDEDEEQQRENGHVVNFIAELAV